MIGQLLTVHIKIQENRNFSRGCWGLAAESSSGERSATEGCKRALSKDPLKAVGLSLSTVGFVGWSLIAVALYASAAVPGRIAFVLLKTCIVAICIAGIFSLGLMTSQLIASDRICVLCFAHAVLVLLACDAGIKTWPKDQIAETDWKDVPAQFQITAFVGGAVALFLLFFIGQTDTALDKDDLQIRVRQVLEKSLDPVILQQLAPCEAGLDKIPIIPNSELIPEFLGVSANGRLRANIIIFYDPLCPHCAALEREFDGPNNPLTSPKQLLELPICFFPESKILVQALWVARQDGKMEKLRKILATTDPASFETTAKLKSLLIAHDFPADAWLDRIKKGEGLTELRYMDKFAATLGIDRLPAMFVDGKRIPSSPRYRESECIRRIIDHLEPVDPKVLQSQ